MKAKIEADLEEKMTKKLNSMLEPFGIVMNLKDNVVEPNDLSSHPTTPYELDAGTPQLPLFPFPNVTVNCHSILVYFHRKSIR